MPKRDIFNHAGNWGYWRKELTPNYIEEGLTKEKLLLEEDKTNLEREMQKMKEQMKKMQVQYDELYGAMVLEEIENGYEPGTISDIGMQPPIEMKIIKTNRR